MSSVAKKALLPLFRLSNKFLSIFDYSVVHNKELIDFYLHEYDSYEHYKEVQTHHNLRKISNVWADPETLDEVADIVRSICPKQSIRGLCHGTRNGFEQNYFNDNHEGFSVLGTDISDSAKEFSNSVVWDFHDTNQDWIGEFDFIYSNSLDQSWKPRKALTTWLNQVNDSGIVILEHTHMHGPRGATEKDPFGVRPSAMPYVISEWFGHKTSVSFRTGKKANNQMDYWLFAIKKNAPITDT